MHPPADAASEPLSGEELLQTCGGASILTCRWIGIVLPPPLVLIDPIFGPIPPWVCGTPTVAL